MMKRIPFNIVICIIQIYNLQQRQHKNQMFCPAESSQTKDENTEQYKKIQQYMFRTSDKIGQGKFSKVFKGFHRQSGQLVAVKVIQYSTIKSKVAEELLKNQVSILRELDHPNIMKCLDILTSQNNCYIVMDFYEGGDLERELEIHKRFEQYQIKKILYEVYKGLTYLNSRSIIHRDFKIANIFLTAQKNIKIGDFGFAVKAKESFKDIDIGSRIYMSPQAMISRQYGPKTQVWAFGVMMYELLHGYTPLSNCKTENELKQKILQPIKFRSGLSLQIKELICQCLMINPQDRISMKQIINTPFMNKLFQEYQVSIIPKQLVSTFYTSSQGCSNKLNTIKQIRNYQQALSILQYCRLVHKTCQKIQSSILSQWLLNLSWFLQQSKPSGSIQKIQKFTLTAKDYYIKYKKQHKDSNIFMTGEQVLEQCKKLHNIVIQTSFSQAITKINISFITMLTNQTQVLSKALACGKLNQYAKYSQVQKFLESHKQNSNKNNTMKTGFSFFNKKQ